MVGADLSEWLEQWKETPKEKHFLLFAFQSFEVFLSFDAILELQYFLPNMHVEGL